MAGFNTVYPKKYAHGFCFAVLCCGYTLTYFPISTRLTSLALCGNLTIAPVPAKQPWWKLINTSCEFIMNNCITTTKQSIAKPCAYFLGYTVVLGHCHIAFHHDIFEWTFNDHLSFHKWNKMYALGINVMPVQTNRLTLQQPQIPVYTPLHKMKISNLSYLYFGNLQMAGF